MVVLDSARWHDGHQPTLDLGFQPSGDDLIVRADGGTGEHRDEAERVDEGRLGGEVAYARRDAGRESGTPAVGGDLLGEERVVGLDNPIHAREVAPAHAVAALSG